MRSALELSKYIISKCYNDDYPISNLQLQKILYYIQGAFYRNLGKRAFDDGISAWQHGPVIRSVYYEYNNFVSSRIRMNIPNNVRNEYTTREIRIIDKLISELRKKEVWELVNMTHKEDPWKSGYEYDGEIWEESMKRWFSEHGEVVDC